MGGIHRRQEPKDMQNVKNNATMYGVFESTGWHVFFEQLCGYHDGVALEFAMALDVVNNSTKVQGLSLSITP